MNKKRSALLGSNTQHVQTCGIVAF